MNINTYQLILDTETKHVSLQIKESFAYGNDCFTSPLSVATLMKEVYKLHQRADEYVYMIALNNKMKLMGLFEISHGIGNASLLDTRGIFIRALQIGASNIMLIHNHPSGITQPSSEDISICKKVSNAGKLMDIPLVDFIIIGCDIFMSFKEKELI